MHIDVIAQAHAAAVKAAQLRGVFRRAIADRDEASRDWHLSIAWQAEVSQAELHKAIAARDEARTKAQEAGAALDAALSVLANADAALANAPAGEAVRLEIAALISECQAMLEQL